MQNNYLKMAAYWRNSLADADSAKGALETNKIKAFYKWYDVLSGRLSNEITELLFNDEAVDVTVIDVILRPRVFISLIKHGKERTAGIPSHVTPLVTFAKMNREGFLFPSSTTIIPRDLLAPLSHGSFSIGEISAYDKYITKKDNSLSAICYDEIPLEKKENEDEMQERHKRYLESWQSYLTSACNLLDNVATPWIEKHENYELADFGYIQKKTQPKGASTHIISLYDHLLVNKKDVPLFNCLAKLTPSNTEPLIATEDTFNDRLAYSGDKFPLALAQRDALGHCININNGNILAVNGPPGTGKTTLLLSVIATLWAKAALKETNPPIVLATSTNNQAVTNIIQAFEKDFSEGTGPMSGRWLPEIKSFGAYFPSHNKKAEVTTKYQTDDFFNEKESKEYIEEALVTYFNKAKIAFPNDDCSSTEKIISLLHKELTTQVSKLVNIKNTWSCLKEARKKIRCISDNIDLYLNEKKNLLSEISSKLVILKKALIEWDKFRANESLFITLFSFLSPIRKKRYYQIKVFLAKNLDRYAIEDNSIEVNKIDSLIKNFVDVEHQQQKEIQEQINNINQLIQQEKMITVSWLQIASELGYKGTREPDLLEVDQLADTQIRFRIFLLTTHYWEGRWLNDVLNIENLDNEKTKKGAKLLENRWHRRMMLTPCVVMTCYMLPSHMRISEHKGQQRYEHGYAYNLADLLIVDEAGQALPEVAAASFALAKKALVIGDTAQIAPVWNITPSIDIGNMLEEKILIGNTQEEINAEYALIAEMGKSSASGSIMKIAQCASRYHYDTDLEKGMYLYEHRRCFDNIIEYCNELCYQGKLQPKKGNGDKTLYPAMGYLHIDGRGSQNNTGSRFNQLEAETISAWLKENKQLIENHYGKPIAEIVAIVTPFSAQVSKIQNILDNQGINASSNKDQVIVGTTHSLQGSEKNIIIFSTVYSKHEDGHFIDMNSSLLNVAVSRAKDSFLVFGDMDLFEIQPISSPRGLLAKYLFSNKENELKFEYKQRLDLVTSDTKIYTLHGAKEHDEFLNTCISTTKNDITIVSPWLNIRKMEEIGFIDSITKAIANGIQVKIITDRSYNTEHSHPEQQKEKELLLFNALECLNSYGITTMLVNRVHSKIVIKDDNLLCIGSFNWFSASRETYYEKYDTSMVYFGERLKEEVIAIYSNLDKRL